MSSAINWCKNDKLLYSLTRKQFLCDSSQIGLYMQLLISLVSQVMEKAFEHATSCLYIQKVQELVL